MKKATELLERLSAQLKYNTDPLSIEVCEYVRVRKELERTPITEEWLLRHGFEKPQGALVSWRKIIGDKTIYVDVHDGISRFEIDLITNYKGYDIEHVLAAPDNAKLATLYDACELCGIELK